MGHRGEAISEAIIQYKWSGLDQDYFEMCVDMWHLLYLFNFAIASPSVEAI